MIRFQVVVFNFERVASFLDNFHKVANFDANRDQILIFDCSRNWKEQKRQVANFVSSRSWTLGKQVRFIRRRNWGIDQGARIEYLQLLHSDDMRPQFIWQFQEHYLDLESPWSIWETDKPLIGGQLKADTIPDGLDIDLEECVKVYEEHADVDIIYADRAKVGLLNQSFYVDGANFSVRTSRALETFTPALLASYKMIYDGSYKWTLFIELDIGRRLTAKGSYWYDLVTKSRFDSLEKLAGLERETGSSLHQVAEEFYGPLYEGYEKRLLAASRRNAFSRKLSTMITHSYLSVAGSDSTQNLIRPLMDKLGVLRPARVLRRKILKQARETRGR